MCRLVVLAIALGLFTACLELPLEGSEPSPPCTYSWFRDQDGDGYGDPAVMQEGCAVAPEGFVAASGDCDDAVASIHPGGTETCDGRDQDCDGQVDEQAIERQTWFEDADGDGHGSDADHGSRTIQACAPPTGYSPDRDDCDDAVASTHPGAEELCNGVDDDCDGAADNGLPQDVYFLDADGDGYGAASSATLDCGPSAEFVADSSDCDDAEPAIHPGAEESCDGIDENCDGVVDDGLPLRMYYVDGDGDGYGGESTGAESCAPISGRLAEGGDCDDWDPAVFPGADEVCNDIDDDCDGLIDFADPGVDASTATLYHADADLDGHGDPAMVEAHCSEPGSGWLLTATDCDDTDPDVNPDALERCNSRDDDCDGSVDGATAIDAITSWPDDDGDGYGGALGALRECWVPTGFVALRGDCDDADPAIHPSAPEACDAAVDSNCDGAVGLVDGDGDGFAACEECDDGNPAVHPGAEELCDGWDNDCNGAVDDDGAGGSPWALYVDADGDGFGGPEVALVYCGAPIADYVENGDDCDDADPERNPLALELCNGVDDDCNGLVPPVETDDDGDGVAECQGDPDDSDSGMWEYECAYLENFDDPSWPAPGWVALGSTGTVGPTYSHGGGLGIRDPDWMYNEDTLVGVEGDMLSAWARGIGYGDAYLGFGASSAGCVSLNMDVRYQYLALVEHDGWGYTTLEETPATWKHNVWYWLTVEFLAGNEVVGTAYLADGSTVVATVRHTFPSPVVGGIAIRTTMHTHMDSIVYCPAP